MTDAERKAEAGRGFGEGIDAISGVVRLAGGTGGFAMRAGLA